MALQDSGKVKFIGVSNTYDVAVLETLERIGGRRVQIVQNRWFEGNQWDTDVLEYCRKNKVQYQSVAMCPCGCAVLLTVTYFKSTDPSGRLPVLQTYWLIPSCWPLQNERDLRLHRWHID